MAWVVRDRPFLQTLRDAMKKREDVDRALVRVTDWLSAEGIDYAVIGGMALVAHGYVRFTNDIDLLTTREGLEAAHQRLLERGYVWTSEKSLQDTENDVTIEFITTGERPAEVSIEIDGRSVITLPKLIELKLASGLTAVHRARDIGDVADLIMALDLPRGLAQQLDPSVRDEYLRLWDSYETSKSSK